MRFLSISFLVCLAFGVSLVYFLNISWYYSLLISAVLFVVFGTILIVQKRTQEKKILTQLYKSLSEIQGKQPESVKSIGELSKTIQELSANQSSEISVLKEQENYRRDFIGNVSHELKTPLFSIQGYLLTLIEGGLQDNKIRDKYLNRINKSVDRLIYIVQDLDLISELESGSMELNIQKFNIRNLCQDVFDLLEQKAINAKINLQFKDAYNLNPIFVAGDIERIEQVLINLIANAINHAGKPADLIVDFTEQENQIKISITDFGIGIQAEHMPRLFERFYRIDRSRSRQMGGSGLGLAIVKHILDAHNKKVFVESQYGKQTTFWFYLDKA